MIPQIVEPFRVPLFDFFRIVNVELVIAICDDAFDILPAQVRAHARPSAGPFIRNDRGIQHQILARRADHDLPVPRLSFLRQDLVHPLLRRRGQKTPQAIRIRVVEQKFPIIDLDPGMFFAPALQDDRINAGPLQIISEGASAIRCPDVSGLRRNA